MRLSRRTVIRLAAVLLVLSLAGIGVYWRIDSNSAQGATASGPSRSDSLPQVSASDVFSTDMATPVEGVEVRLDTLVMVVTAGGDAASFRSVVVRSQVSGQIRSLRVRENQVVGPGAVLVEIDSTQFALALRDAQARLRQAEATFEENTLGDEMVDAALREERRANARARSNMESVEIALERARLDLARTRVVAPFAGRVANVKVVVGQHVNAGEELFTVQTMDPIKVVADVLEGNVAFLQPGRAARVKFAAYPEVFEGRIEWVNPVVDPQWRTAQVTVSVRNPNGRILPGMYASFSLAAERFPDRVLVPIEAVLERDVDRRTLVFVYQPGPDGTTGRAQWRYVTTGMRNDREVEIVENPDTEMVRPGEIVLVGGHASLQHDVAVRLVDNAFREGGRPR